MKVLYGFELASLYDSKKIPLPEGFDFLVRFTSGGIRFFRERSGLLETIEFDKDSGRYMDWYKSSYPSLSFIKKSIEFKSVQFSSELVQDCSEDKYTITAQQAFIALQKGVKVMVKGEDGYWYQASPKNTVEWFLKPKRIFKLSPKIVEIDQTWDDVFDKNNELLQNI